MHFNTTNPTKSWKICTANRARVLPSFCVLPSNWEVDFEPWSSDPQRLSIHRCSCRPWRGKIPRLGISLGKSLDKETLRGRGNFIFFSSSLPVTVRRCLVVDCQPVQSAVPFDLYELYYEFCWQAVLNGVKQLLLAKNTRHFSHKWIKTRFFFDNSKVGGKKDDIFFSRRINKRPSAWSCLMWRQTACLARRWCRGQPLSSGPASWPSSPCRRASPPCPPRCPWQQSCPGRPWGPAGHCPCKFERKKGKTSKSKCSYAMAICAQKSATHAFLTFKEKSAKPLLVRSNNDAFSLHSCIL